MLNNVVVKFNELNSHLSTVVRETPKYMTVNVAVSETDKSAIQAQFDANVRNMNKQHQKNMAEIRQAFDTQITKEYEHSKAHYKRIHDMLRQMMGSMSLGFVFGCVPLSFGLVFALCGYRRWSLCI